MMKAITYTAPTMHCPSCVMLLEGLEDDLRGVQSIGASLKSKEVVVRFDESLITDEGIRAAALAQGYQLLIKDNQPK